MTRPRSSKPSGTATCNRTSDPGGRLGPSADAAAAEIRRGIEEAFDRLAGLIER